MLLRISAENVLSIAEQQELSLIATSLKGPSTILREVPGSKLKSLPSAIVYGANASGKSNLIKAISFMRRAVLFSHSQGNPRGGVPRTSFALDPVIKAGPTVMEADFAIENIRYRYGFECDDHQFISEWLYEYPEGKKRKLFERKKGSVDFGTSLKGPKKILVELMRPNSLFLSTATQNDHEGLSKIAAFFNSMGFVNTISVAKNTINRTFKEGKIDNRIINFLQGVGTGIISFRQQEAEIPEQRQAMAKDFVEIFRKHLGEDAPSEGLMPELEKDVYIEFGHNGRDGTACYLGPEQESSGTRRLAFMLSSVFQALDTGSLVLIDELDASLHTLAAEQIVRLFADPNVNTRGAQLIATTHDTNLLRSRFLRRDQIWFAEKDREGATSIYPLSDIQSRHTDDFEKGYLEGRYGAVPFSGSTDFLFSEQM